MSQTERGRLARIFSSEREARVPEGGVAVQLPPQQTRVGVRASLHERSEFRSTKGSNIMDYHTLIARLQQADCTSKTDAEAAEFLNVKNITETYSRFGSFRTLAELLTPEEYAAAHPVGAA